MTLLSYNIHITISQLFIFYISLLTKIFKRLFIHSFFALITTCNLCCFSPSERDAGGPERGGRFLSLLGGPGGKFLSLVCLKFLCAAIEISLFVSHAWHGTCPAQSWFLWVTIYPLHSMYPLCIIVPILAPIVPMWLYI